MTRLLKFLVPVHRGSLRRRLQWGISWTVLIMVVAIVVAINLFVSSAESMAWNSRQKESALSVSSSLDILVGQVQSDLRFFGSLSREYIVSHPGLTYSVLYKTAALSEIIRVNYSGKVVLAEHKGADPILENTFTIPQSNWFLQAQETGQYIGSLQVSADGVPYIVLSVQASEGDVVAGILNMSRLWEVVSRVNTGLTGQVYLVDGQGMVLAHRDHDIILQRTSIIGRPEMVFALQNGAEWNGEYENFQGQRVRGISFPVEIARWYVFVETPLDETHRVTWQAMFLLGSGVMLFGLAVILITNRLLGLLVLEPLDELGHGAARLGDGELAYRVNIPAVDEFARVAETFNMMASQLKQREDALTDAQERLKDAFGRYVAPEVADDVLAHGVELGGETLIASVLFIDIRGFTALSERMTPVEVVRLLNTYFTTLEPVIREQGGWINKFGGDSLLAVFGAPKPYEDHVARAVRSALGVRCVLADFNEKQRREYGYEIRIGMGLTCGEVVAGNVGSANRLEYTVVGDVVNLAARIQGLSEQLGADILVSAEAYGQVAEQFPARALAPVQVRGKAEPVSLFALE